jgi:hypothetical protein
MASQREKRVDVAHFDERGIYIPSTPLDYHDIRDMLHNGECVQPLAGVMLYVRGKRKGFE